MSLFGLLNVDKPPGVTSRDVVNHVQRIAGKAKVGHAGTLDPLAVGVLVVCLGPATRLIEYVQRMPKCYRAVFRLGCESDTEDIEGEIRKLTDPPRPSIEEIRAAAESFIGRIQQRPPDYSAVKVRGRRAYDLARSGKSVELSERTVSVYEFQVLEYDYPHLKMDIRCGSGTYVRALGRDLAATLGTAAVMESLQRTAIGSFLVQDAVELEKIDGPSLARLLLPASRAVEALPRALLTAGDVQCLAVGQAVDVQNVPDCPDGEIAAFDEAGSLVAVLTSGQDGLRPVKNFAHLFNSG